MKNGLLIKNKIILDTMSLANPTAPVQFPINDAICFLVIAAPIIPPIAITPPFMKAKEIYRLNLPYEVGHGDKVRTILVFVLTSTGMPLIC